MTEQSILVSIPAKTLRAIFSRADGLEKFHLELRVDQPISAPHPPKENDSEPVEQSHTTIGKYELSIDGQIYVEWSLKDVLIRVLHEFNELDESFLRAFEKCGTLSRNYIAQDPDKLYLRSPHLRRHAAEFLPGWWVGTNVGSKQVASIIEAVRKCVKTLSRADFFVTITRK